METAERVPAEVFSPGEYIRDELSAREWTQQDLANILNRPLVAVNQMITGKRGITPETAKALAAAFGTSAELWLNLENAYQLAQVKTESDSVSERAKLYEVAPVSEMARRGWIASSRDVKVLRAELTQFFETDDLSDIKPSVAARKSTSYDDLTMPQRAWCVRARWLSRTISAAKYDKKKLAEFLTSVREITPHPENIRHLPATLAEIGIRLVLISHLEKTKIDGAAFWDRELPVVAMSLRFDRIDNFWHTLIHELVHIKNRDSVGVVDSEIQGSEDDPGEQDEVELKTNEEAAGYLVPQDKLNSFIIRIGPLYARTKVVQFAQANKVHPGIVLGQLHHRKEVPPKNLRDLLVPIRYLIIGVAMTDGWGHQPGVVQTG